MKVLNYNAGRNYSNYLVMKSREALEAIDNKMKSFKTIEEWEKEKERLKKAYEEAYPRYIFKERSPVKSKLISKHEFTNYRIENHIFESYPGWFVNASVYLPKEDGIYPGVICATGHSSKTFPNYTSSAQLIARSGYIAISFDPPGMQGEHNPGDGGGNNHFEDGVRGYLSGFWSQTFFVLDAMRCIDYLQTRDDVDQNCGFAMTGISGGGTTTFHTSILENRLKCIAPVCCISDEVGLTLTDRYTFCCETKGHAHWTNGIKNSTLLAISAPLPMMVCSGGKDEVFDYRLAEKTIKNTKKIYNLYDSEDIDLFVDNESGHAYSVLMVNQVIRFFDRHLKNKERAKEYYHYVTDDIEFPSSEQLKCGAIDTTTMYSVNLAMFSKSDAGRKKPTPDNLAQYFAIDKKILPIDVTTVFESPTIWFHTLSGIVFYENNNIEIPGLLLKRSEKGSDEIILYADDEDKWSNLENNGFLASKAAFLEKNVQKSESTILSIDITGIGELKIEPEFYDLASWSRADRLFSYLSVVMGSSMTAQRTKEILSILNYLKKSKKYSSIKCVGKGVAAIPVLYASYIFKECKKTILENLPISYESMARYVPNSFMPTSVIYNAPENFEIFQIVNAMKNLTLVNPVQADMTVLTKEQASYYYNENTELIFSDTGMRSDIL